MPFAGFKNQAECEAKNQDKQDPGAYCATIRRAVEGKSAAYEEAFVKALEGEDTGWLDTKAWHNDRIKSAFMNDALVDYEGDRVTLEAQVLAMPPHMERGFFEWMHGRDDDHPEDESKRGPPIKIGEPVGWRVKDQKVEVRWGIYGREDMGGFRESDDVSQWIDQKWEKIQEGGTVSMTFLPNEWTVVQEDGRQIREISLIHLQSVGYVKTFAASPGAVMTGLPAAKGLVIVMKALDLPSVSRETPTLTDQVIEEFLGKMEKQARDPGAVCGELWFNGTEAQRNAFKGGTAGRGRGEAPPEAWMDDCKAQVSKMQTLKTASKYAPPEGPLMATDEEKQKAAEEAAKAKAEKAAEELKTLEAKLAEAKAAQGKPLEKQPPEGGCPEGKVWDPDAGECVDKVEEGGEEEKITRKEFDELKKLATENRELSMRLLQENQPAPEDQLKSLRDAIAGALGAGTVTEDVAASVLGAFDAALPKEKDKPLEERVQSLVQEVVDAKMSEVQSVQTEALDAIEVEMKEKLGMPVNASRVKPAVTGPDGGLTLEKAGETFMEQIREGSKTRLTGIRGGL